MSFLLRSPLLRSLLALFAVSALALAPAHAQKRRSASTKTQNSKPSARASAPVLDDALKAALAQAPKAAQVPDSDYVRLLDLGRVTVKPDGTVIGEYREAFKLFNERARHLSEVSIPYNASYQEVKITRARTIKRDGTVLEVKPQDMRVSLPYSDYLMYDDAVGMGCSMPGIEDECVIDYSYQMVTRPLLMPGQFWAYWGFSDTSPVVLSRYTVTLPADKPFQYKVYNDDTLKPVTTRSADNKTVTHVFERRNLKPVEREPSMPSMPEVRVWLEASSLPSWQEVAAWFWSLAKPQITPNAAIRKTVAQLIEGKETPSDKARAIYDWVANRTRYVGLEFGLSAYRPHPAADVHKNLYGDCKDKAILLVSMLQIAGMRAYPVLLKAGDPRPVSSGLPTLNAFNHCIALAEIEGKEVWLDATAETCAFGDIPAGDRGSEALVVRDGKGEFRQIPEYKPAENGVRVLGDITVQPDFSAQAMIEIQMLGALGQSMRSSVRAIPPTRRTELAQQIAQRLFPRAALKGHSIPTGIEKEGAFIIKLHLGIPDFAEKTGKLLLMPLDFGRGAERGNPFTKETRTHPIVERNIAQNFAEITLRLPQGYALSETPDEIRLANALISFERSFKISPDKRAITLVEAVEEKSGVIPATQYKQVQDYFNQLLKSAKPRLILREEKP